MSTGISEASMESCFGEGKMFPPGFRFHPTDEELVLYYLKRKICRRRLKPDIIGETDVYKWDPEDLPGLCKLKSGDRQWFFFSPRDRKYPNGARSNRATQHGYWKATGKDRTITCNSRPVGVKKTLVFYRGRAPSGKRTDWVMHEYTMDEEELKRCPSVLDYFALYKVYKKSGPGPKNGEQYGAPFREEDWAEDDCLTMKGPFDQENFEKQGNEVVPVDNSKSNDQVEKCSNDLEAFINQIAQEAVLVEPSAFNYECTLEKLMGDEETLTTSVDNCLEEVNVDARSTMPRSEWQQYDVQATFDLTQSGTSQLHMHEGPEVTSAPNSHGLEPRVVEEDFLEDFLEMDDLIGPQPTVQDFAKPATGQPTVQDFAQPATGLENFQLDELDGLGEFDFFQDTVMFFNDTGQGEQAEISQAHMNSFAMESMQSDEPRQASNPYLNHQEMGTALQPGHMSHPGVYHDENGMLGSISQSSLYNFENETLSHQQQQLNGSQSQQFCEPWRLYQESSVFTPMEASQGTILPPASGVVFDGSSGSNLPRSNQNQDSEQDHGTDSWFSSALWKFVESIPTTPASAAESTLVNRAFERMSSFSRVRMNTSNLNVAAGNPSTNSSYRKSKNGLLGVSIFGVLCAILWFFIGTSVRVLSRYISS